jgi:hypothetical protein
MAAREALIEPREWAPELSAAPSTSIDAIEGVGDRTRAGAGAGAGAGTGTGTGETQAAESVVD